MPFTISEKTTQVFVAINTPTALENQIKGANTYDEMNKACLLYTSYKLHPEEFAFQTQTVRRPTGSKRSARDVRSMNRYLIQQRLDIDRYISELESRNSAYSVGDILMRYQIAQNGRCV